jgi:hypothetical protein
MCENCDRQRAEIMHDLLQLLEDHPDSRLMEIVNRHVDESMKQIIELRIKPAIERDPTIAMPSMREIREAVKATLVASTGALALAAYASSTPSFTDEGGVPPGLILGIWAGTVVNQEVEIQVDEMENQIRSLLGLGDN